MCHLGAVHHLMLSVRSVLTLSLLVVKTPMSVQVGHVCMEANASSHDLVRKMRLLRNHVAWSVCSVSFVAMARAFLSRHWMRTLASALLDGEGQIALWTWMSARAVHVRTVGYAMTRILGRRARLHRSWKHLHVRVMTMSALLLGCSFVATAAFLICVSLQSTIMPVVARLDTKATLVSWTLMSVRATHV